MNLDVTADDSCLDPHVSCVKTSHPAAQLDVNPEQRSVRQSMMSGPHHGDSAHTHTTFGTSGKFIRASSSTGQAWLSAIRHRPSRSASAPLPAGATTLRRRQTQLIELRAQYLRRCAALLPHPTAGPSARGGSPILISCGVGLLCMRTRSLSAERTHVGTLKSGRSRLVALPALWWTSSQRHVLL
jgi:hypothetical protein